MNNKIIEIQDMLFQEMKRLTNDEFLVDENNNKEIQRSTALYNQTTNFLKAVNSNIAIRNIAKWEEIKYDELMKELGLTNEKI